MVSASPDQTLRLWDLDSGRARAVQTIKEGWAKRLRQIKGLGKKKPK